MNAINRGRVDHERRLADVRPRPTPRCDVWSSAPGSSGGLAARSFGLGCRHRRTGGRAQSAYYVRVDRSGGAIRQLAAGLWLQNGTAQIRRIRRRPAGAAGRSTRGRRLPAMGADTPGQGAQNAHGRCPGIAGTTRTRRVLDRRPATGCRAERALRIAWRAELNVVRVDRRVGPRHRCRGIGRS
jgi:hypothetical protein